MTAERDSETQWANKYRDDVERARAERDALWKYVHSGMAITSHEGNCETCGLNEVPCAEMKRLVDENMRAFDAVMKFLAK